MRLSPLKVAAVHVACLIGFAIPSLAQVQRGAIHGTVLDESGGVVPGAMLQLTSALTAPRETITGSRGEYRFPDLDPGEYTVRVTLPGFAPLVRSAIIVGVGTYVEIDARLSLEGLAEEVVVEAATPVLDTRRQGNVTNFDQATLNGVPTARDPWALLPHVPGVSTGRPNVGGSESTNQAQFAARGDNGANTMWNIDGITITDMAVGGTSTTYYDFNAFEEVQFTTGGLDSRQQTGGLAINLVSKRGGNAWRGAGHVYFSNDGLQGENITTELNAAGLSGNRIRQLAEYGGDGGGPLWQNRAWLWVGVSRNDVRQLAINGFLDNSIINTTAARGDVQLSDVTRASLLYHRAEKLKDGRDAGITRPPETTWNQGGAAQIYKVEATRVVGSSLFLSGKFAYVDSPFALIPKSGLDGQAYQDFATQIWHGSFQYSINDRPQYQTYVDGQLSRDRHELRFGFQYRDTSSSARVGWPGDGTFTIVNRSNLPAGVGLARLTRATVVENGTRAFGVYFGDVVSIDRWTLDAGIRVDRQRGRNEASAAPANGLAPSILPALEYPGGQSYTWTDFSPRLGVSHRLTDRTIVRGSYARYANQLASSLVGFESATVGGLIEYFFQDVNGDRLAQPAELLGPTGFVQNVDPANPAAPFGSNRLDPAIRMPITQVVTAGVEREVMPHFSVGVNAGTGLGTRSTWSLFTGLTRDDFVECTTCGVAGVTSSTPIYRLAPGVSLPPGNARTLTNREDYHRRYWNVDLLATKRLADRWMLRGFVTWQDFREYFDDPARSIQDPTPRYDAFPSGYIDGGLAVNSTPGAEFPIHTRWLYSLSGLYELPGGVSVAGTIYGRQGYPRGEIFTVTRPGGLGLTPVLLDRDLDVSRFPSVHFLDLRLQKPIALGPARATLTLDVFNALNEASTIRQINEGTATNFRNPLEVVAPRLVRLGLRLQF